MSVTIFSKINPIISVGFLEVPFGIVGKRVKLPPTRPHPCLKLVTIMLETCNLVRKYTHIFSENIPLSTTNP